MRLFFLGFLFLLIPGCYCIPSFLKEKFTRTLIVKFCMTCFIPAFSSAVLYCLLNRYSWYEYLFLDSIGAVFISLIVYPLLFERNSFSYKNILKCLCLYSLSVALYSALTYGQTIIHSDTATATILADSILRHKNLFPESWNYANGDVWIATFHILVLPFIRIINNQSLVRMLASALWILFACFGIFLLGKSFFKDTSWTIAIPFVFLFFTDSAIAGSADMMLWEVAYTGQIVWVTFCLLLTWGFFSSVPENNKIHLIKTRKNVFTLCLSFIIYFLITLGGSRAFGEIILPIFLSFIVFAIIEAANKKTDLKIICMKTSFTLAAVLIPSLIGLLCYKQISLTHNVNNTENNAMTFIGDITNWVNNFQVIFSNHFVNFGIETDVSATSIVGLKNFVIIIFTILVSFVIPVLQLRRIQSEPQVVVFFCIFAFIHNFLIGLLVVFMGKTSARYLLTSQFIEIFISARYIYAHWIKENKIPFVRNILIFIMAIGICINSLYFVCLSKGWRHDLNVRKDFASWIMSSGAKKGYATFWNAYTNEVYSNLGIRFGAVNFDRRGFSSNYWLVDSDAYDFCEDKSSCLLLSDEELKAVEEKHLDILQIFGPAKQTLKRDNYNLFVFEHDISRDFISWIKYFPKEVNGKLKIPASLLNFSPETPTNEEGCPVSISTEEETLAYGPYAEAFPGTYRITILYDCISENSEKLATISCTTDCGQNTLKTEVIATSGSNEFCFDVIIPRRSQNVEIVTRSHVPNFTLKGYEVECITSTTKK